MIAVSVFCLATVDVMAAGKPDPYETAIESPFKGVVTVTTQISVSVKGETKFKNAGPQASGSKDERGKPPRQSFHFSINKDTKLTRDGKPCDLKAVQKGDGAVVEFTPKKDSQKRIASKIDFSSSGGDAGDDKKTEDKKPGDKK